MNKKIFLVIFLILLSPLLFVFLGLGFLFYPIFFTDIPLEISCSSKEQKCEAYSMKFYQPFLYGFLAKKLEESNPQKSQEIKDKLSKIFTEPKQEFFVSEIKGISCKKLFYKTWGDYSANISLNNKKKVLLGLYKNQQDCEQACKIAKSRIEKNEEVEKYSLIFQKDYSEKMKKILKNTEKKK